MVIVSEKLFYFCINLTQKWFLFFNSNLFKRFPISINSKSTSYIEYMIIYLIPSLTDPGGTVISEMDFASEGSGFEYTSFNFFPLKFVNNLKNRSSKWCRCDWRKECKKITPHFISILIIRCRIRCLTPPHSQRGKTQASFKIETVWLEK